jgi:hypothetical protein
MTLAGARRTEEERVFPLLYEACRGQLVEQGAIHFLVEIKVEAIERSIRIAEARLFVAPIEEPILATLQLVGDERADKIERHKLLDLRLTESRSFRKA